MSVKYTSNSAEAIATIKKAKARALEICGGTCERYAKENLTKNKSVRTDVLRGSITHEQVDDDTEAIGTGVYYAPYVELGHNQQPGRYVPAIKKRLVASHVAAKPYLRPALENNRDEYRKIIETELSTI